jgi:hypothetical protein
VRGAKQQKKNKEIENEAEIHTETQKTSTQKAKYKK